MQCRPKQLAFTLIELLVVIAIIAMLTGILVPSLSRAKGMARRVKCLSNLRNMIIAANQYAILYDGRYPLAMYTPKPGGTHVYVSWDFKYRADGTIEPGLLWSIGQDMEVQQCPSYEGPANWAGDKYTGYNYNTSYIGHGGAYDPGGEGKIINSVRIMDVKDPTNCALFGDGEYSGGANKFMRSPFQAPGDREFGSRSAGTQGFRHLGGTSVGFCDGHAATLDQRYTKTSDPMPSFTEDTGFISPDNSLYDLE